MHLFNQDLHTYGGMSASRNNKFVYSYVINFYVSKKRIPQHLFVLKATEHIGWTSTLFEDFRPDYPFVTTLFVSAD